MDPKRVLVLLLAAAGGSLTAALAAAAAEAPFPRLPALLLAAFALGQLGILAAAVAESGRRACLRSLWLPPAVLLLAWALAGATRPGAFEWIGVLTMYVLAVALPAALMAVTRMTRAGGQVARGGPRQSPAANRPALLPGQYSLAGLMALVTASAVAMGLVRLAEFPPERLAVAASCLGLAAATLLAIQLARTCRAAWGWLALPMVAGAAIGGLLGLVVGTGDASHAFALLGAAHAAVVALGWRLLGYITAVTATAAAAPRTTGPARAGQAASRGTA